MKFPSFILLCILLVLPYSIMAQESDSSLAQPPIGSPIVDRDVPTRDIIHADDVIINGGSLCVGFDCFNGENFGFDTVRLKENNLRIHFDDTSVGSFPGNDWRITINDQTNGGDSYFAVDDVTAGNNPFRIEAGAGANAIHVSSSGGNVGLGTNTPVVELQITDGDSPTMRLEQNGTNGFTPQTWDIAGNESNFFVRDATNGSTLPFRIQPGAPTGTLSLGDDGNIGVGMAGTNYPNPNASIDLNATNQGLQLNRLTAAQRDALGVALGATEVGVVVFNTDDGLLYIWDGALWKTAGADDQTADVFQLNGNDLELSLEDDGVATQTVDLSGYLDNTDDQVADVFQLSGNNLELSLENDGAATQIVDLSGYLDNTDDQVADVFQLSGNNLELSLENDGAATQIVDLSGYLDNTDDQVADVFQLNGNNLELSLENDGAPTQTVNLSGYLDNTDDQQLSLTGNTLALEDGGNVDLSGYLDNTDNQNISGSGLAGNILTIGISGGTSEDVDLSVFNNSGTDDQQLTLAGNSLDLEDGGSVDLSGYLDNTDNQNIITFNLEGNLLKLQLENSNVVEVDLSSILIPLEVENASQQLQIDDLIARVEFLEACACQLPIDDIISDPNSPYLFQNVPNPYGDVTSIRYYIPFEYNKAEIVLTTVTGQILKRIPVNEVGEGSIDFSRSALSSGIYLYTLYLDGKRIDTKRMLIE